MFLLSLMRNHRLRKSLLTLRCVPWGRSNAGKWNCSSYPVLRFFFFFAPMFPTGLLDFYKDCILYGWFVNWCCLGVKWEKTLILLGWWCHCNMLTFNLRTYVDWKWKDRKRYCMDILPKEIRGSHTYIRQNRLWVKHYHRWQRHYIMLKASIYQEDITAINIFSLNTRVTKYEVNIELKK